ncbi:MAG: hypothetical protein BGO28_03775 [Alphaproteobacteria bacterium 43-37]|nr:MAG: hypothetical protein BGO28_03775 [Alphaproteobacteria bacterium 43-37]
MLIKKIIAIVICCALSGHSALAQSQFPEYIAPVSAINGSNLRLVRFVPGDAFSESQLHHAFDNALGRTTDVSEFSQYVLTTTYTLTPFFSPWLIYSNHRPNNAIGFAQVRPLNNEVVSITVSRLEAGMTVEFEKLMTAFVSRFVGKILVHNIKAFSVLLAQKERSPLRVAEIERNKQAIIAKLSNEEGFTPKALLFSSNPKVSHQVTGGLLSASEPAALGEFQPRVCRFVDELMKLDVDIIGAYGTQRYANDFKKTPSCRPDFKNIMFEKGSFVFAVQSESGWWQWGTVVFTTGVLITICLHGAAIWRVIGRLFGNVRHDGGL